MKLEPHKVSISFGVYFYQLTCSVDVTLDHVPAQSFTDRQRAFEVHSASCSELAQSRAPQGFKRSIRSEEVLTHFDYCEVDSIDRDRIANACSFQDFVRFDHEEGAVCSAMGLTYLAYLYYEPGEDSHL